MDGFCPVYARYARYCTLETVLYSEQQVSRAIPTTNSVIDEESPPRDTTNDTALVTSVNIERLSFVDALSSLDGSLSSSLEITVYI